ncbi:putative membrane protein [Weissella viridescens]|nr:putative membrane protein [Weissella viridescens]
MHKIQLHKNVKAFLVIALISVLLLSPMILNHTAIMGVDSYFQNNRIYEAAMQIKHGNFSFMNLYSFQQSGRIVNEVYSPLLGYVFGALLLVTGTWFKFEVLVNGILFFAAGTTAYFAARKLRVPLKISIATAVIFMTSISIYGYIFGGTWRAFALALVPLLVIPMVNFYNRDWSMRAMLSLSVIVAAILQAQLLTMMLALPFLVVPFIVGWLKTSHKVQALVRCIMAAVVALVLSLNVILPYLELVKQNTLVPPVSMNLQNGTMDLIIPNSDRLDCTLISFILYLAVAGMIMFWHKIQPIEKIITIIAIIYILLGSSLVPWQTINEQFPALRNFLQMPSRLSIIGVPLLMIGTAAIYTNIYRANRSEVLKQVVSFVTIVMSIMAVMSLLVTFNKRVLDYRNSDVSIAKGLETTDNVLVVRDDNGKKLNAITDLQPALHSHDLSKLITVIDRVTPDYLPVKVADYSQVNYYQAYRKEIAEQRTDYQHVVKPNGVLELRWQAEKSGTQNVPAVAYYRTKVKLNNHEIKPSQRKISDVGSLKVDQKQGDNVLSLQYVPAKSTMFGVLLATLSWVVALIAVAILAIRQRSDY